MVDRWGSRLLTAEAAAALCAARLLIGTTRFKRWQATLGRAGEFASDASAGRARVLASHVECSAGLMPFSTKCLARAMALSWMLRSRAIGHTLVFAVRPKEDRGSADRLHAWVEVGGEAIIGKLPGPWFETLRLGGGYLANKA